MKTHSTAVIVSSLWGLLFVVAGAKAQSPPASQPASDTNRVQEAMPHITIDHTNRTVDLNATVILREGGWLELLACSPGTRTHESILVVPAQPRHIHLALITIGLEPGGPMRWTPVGDEYKFHPPHGSPIAVSILYEQDGEIVEVPANEWIFDRNSGDILSDNTWLFTGSVFNDATDPPTYRADSEGSVLSIVNFGDEVLARPTDKTNENDQGIWRPKTDKIPEVGTQVLLRLRPANAAVDQQSE